MIAYPDIPLPAQVFSGEEYSPSVRTEMDNGLLHQEGRFATILKSYSVSWVLSPEEFALFEEWFTVTLAGGALVFALPQPVDGVIANQPFRFASGGYKASASTGGHQRVSAVIESLQVGTAAPTRTPTVPGWYRIGLDPAESQVLGYTHRNARLTVRPDEGSTTTLRIFPPIDPGQYIYFGIDNQGDGDTLITNQDVSPITPLPTPSFPSVLPRMDYNIQSEARHRMERLPMDGANVRQWVAFPTTTKDLEVNWLFTLEQLAVFQEFFFTTLESGSRAFTMDLPVRGSFIPSRVRFLGDTFQESYVPHNRYRVRASIRQSVTQTHTPPDWRMMLLGVGRVSRGQREE